MPRIKTCNTNISFRLDSKLNKQFQSLYPQCMSLFLRRCIEQAVSNPDLFNKIFFYNKEYVNYENN